MNDINLNEIFTTSPELEDFVNFAQFSHDFRIPTKKGFMMVSMALLWESEEIEVAKDSAKGIHPDDMLTRGEIIKMETLVKSISKIGNEVFQDNDDDTNRILKNKLRGILNVSSPKLIDYMMEMYSLLVNKRSEYVDKYTEELKKNSLSELMDINPL